MAQTPFVDIKSEDILSAHVSGIQHIINKLETILSMKTSTKTNHTLTAVIDQEDATLHNFIYEGTTRNWLNSPAPIIKRNGTPISAAEYSLKAAQGAVVFDEQQDPSDAITADFSYVTDSSQVIEDINAALNLRPVGMSGAFFHYPGTYRTHSIGNDGDYIPFVNTSDGTEHLNGTVPGNVVVSADFVGQTTATKALAYNPGYTSAIPAVVGEIEFFPFPVSERTTYDSMAVKCGTAAGTGNIMMGVYKHENGKPGTLIAKTAITTFVANIWRELAFQTTDGTITLEPGFYWIARANSASVRFDRCLNAHNAIKLGDFPQAGIGQSFGGTSSNHQYGAIRTTGFGFTIDIPANTSALTLSLSKRAQYCSPWIRRKM